MTVASDIAMHQSLSHHPSDAASSQSTVHISCICAQKQYVNFIHMRRSLIGRVQLSSMAGVNVGATHPQTAYFATTLEQARRLQKQRQQEQGDAEKLNEAERKTRKHAAQAQTQAEEEEKEKEKVAAAVEVELARLTKISQLKKRARAAGEHATHTQHTEGHAPNQPYNYTSYYDTGRRWLI